MTNSKGEGLGGQHNHSSGTFIGGDNHGVVNNVLLDPGTRDMLAKMSAKAPELADLLRKSLRQGFISPSAAEALMLAARNINEDVAYSLRIAGQNINEEVATDLRVAGENINEVVVTDLKVAGQNIEDAADRFVRVKDDLNDTAGELDTFLRSLRATIGQLSLQAGSAQGRQLGPAATDTYNPGGFLPPPQGGVDKWWLGFRLICGGLGVGILAGEILMHQHLGIYATLAGLAGLAVVLIPIILVLLRKADE
jgi:hypothetical protein